MNAALQVALAFLALTAGQLGPVCTWSAPQGASSKAASLPRCEARVGGRHHEGSILTDSNLVRAYKRGKWTRRGQQPDTLLGDVPCARRITL